MSHADQTGKGTGRKLGRGLSALLGTPVTIRVDPVEDEKIAAESTDDDVVRSSISMQEQVPVRPKRVSLTEAMRSLGISPAEPSSRLSTPKESGVGSQEHHSGGLLDLPVEQIVPNPRQPRTDFDQTAITALAASIRQAGLMQPIMVRPVQSGYELVAGERRWRAAKLLGLRTIPAIVRVLDDEASAELALIENIHREDLNPMDRASALRRLTADFELTHQQLADRVGLDRATVTNLLRLSELDPNTADFVRRGAISQSHGKALLALENLRLRTEFANRVVSEGWSVRELERRVQHALAAKPSSPATASRPESEPGQRTANVADLERRLGEHLGTKVSLQLGRKKGSGRLIVDFYTLDQFDGLMSRFGFRAEL